MLKGYASETHHIQQQQAQVQVIDANTAQQTYIGTLASYNPQTGYGTVLNPQNIDNGGVPVISSPIPIYTSWIGTANGLNQITGGNEPYGIQIAYFGGSAEANINGGEQVLVIQVDADQHYAVCGLLIPTVQSLPPGGNQIPIIGRAIQPGEMVIVTPAQSVIFMDAEGSLHCYQQQVNNAGGNLKAGVQGGIVLQTTNGASLLTDPMQGDIDIYAYENLNESTINGNINIVAVNGSITEYANLSITRTAQNNSIYDTAGQNITIGAALNITRTAVAGNITDTAGTLISLTAGGIIDLTAGTNFIAQSGTAMTFSAGTAMTLNAPGLISLNAAAINAGVPAIPYLPLLTSFFLTLFNSHIHAGVTAGAGSTGPPTIAATPNYPNTTQTFFAN